MLFETIHIPAVYFDLPNDEDTTNIYCSMLIAILHSTLRNCVVLVDENGVIEKDLAYAIKEWPPKFSKKGMELMELLKKRDRFVPTKLFREALSSTCVHKSCFLAKSIYLTCSPELLLGKKICVECNCLTNFVCVENYSISPFIGIREQREVINLTAGQWEKREFEKSVWLPIFRHAKHIKFFDRYIGRSLKYNRELDRFDVAAHYENNLNWILSQIISVSGEKKQLIEIYCGVGADNNTRQNPSLAAKTLKAWAKSRERYFGRITGHEINIYIKYESREDQLRHSRFLITDQIAVLFEGGFELLREDGYVKDTVIALIPNPEDYERDIHRLPDVL